ncbi:sigma-70 family RNA polymerase sigma factor [Woodsholea maritima]|uniref:sigma-70 family RNA polymerase sigma factor n=1 Tax=Woodsholea maritima TaxID=240237 RepID=UPI000372BA4D|nr:sigma-70 family RNA polymerase sigma factor [Woodsholea maritima]
MAHDPDSFHTHRHHLFGLAYRMLGSVAEAEDAVQDTYLRWHARPDEDILNPKAYLSTLITRLCLDRLRSARHRREHYVGPWLPEPLIHTHEQIEPSAELSHIRAQDASMALMMALERLTPLERAAFLLHDIFDMDYDAIAQSLERTPAACRQLAARARTHVQSAKPRFDVDQSEARTLTNAFFAACQSGDLAGLTQILHSEANLYTDGGGIKTAALNIIKSGNKIARFFHGLVRKGDIQPPLWSMPLQINGLEGRLSLETDGTLQTTALELAEGKVQGVYVVRNPEKITHLWALVPAHLRPSEISPQTSSDLGPGSRS